MTYVPEALRREVNERADNCCEYCLLHQDDNFFAHEVDHIIAEKHHGETAANNLCLSCFDCNRHKGSDIASIDLDTGDLIPLFHPRRDNWEIHFDLDGGVVVPLTAIGRVTVHILDMNSVDRIIKRAELIQLDRYPCRQLTIL